MSAISSSLGSSSSLLALLGSNNASTGSTSILGSASASAGDAVTVDLSEIAKAASSGDSSTRAAAVAQLKTDLASEQTALLGSIESSDAATADIGDQLLSTIYGGTGYGGPGAGNSASQNSGVGVTLDTTA